MWSIFSDRQFLLRSILTTFLGFALVVKGFATPPQLSSFDQVISRFWSEDFAVFTRISERLAHNQASDSLEIAGLKDGMRVYVENINADFRIGLDFAESTKNPESLTVWYLRLRTNIVGFRRTLDQLLILSLRTNPKLIDESLELDLRRVWDVERELSWRIDSEISHFSSTRVHRAGS